MTTVVRLVTHVELDGEPGPRDVSVSALLTAELDDARELVLLDDRGWSTWTSGAGQEVEDLYSVDEIERTARVVVGPDEPPEGRTAAEEAALHWDALAGRLRGQGVLVDGAELAELAEHKHDVVLGERLRAMIGL